MVYACVCVHGTCICVRCRRWCVLSIRWGFLDCVFIYFDFGCSSFLYFQIILFPVLKFLYLQIILFPMLKRLMLRLVLHIIGLVILLLLMQLFRGAVRIMAVRILHVSGVGLFIGSVRAQLITGRLLFEDLFIIQPFHYSLKQHNFVHI